MATILRMPEVLANAKEAVVSAWTVSEGSEFAAGDTLAEVETEKALVDLPAEQAGILGRILAQPGESTEVGAPIAVLIAKGETEADIDAALGTVASGAPQRVATPVPELVEGPAPELTAVPEALEGPPASSTTRLFVSPIARVRAREKGVDLSLVVGTGPGGRIVKADVEGVSVSLGGPSTSSGTAAGSGAGPSRTSGTYTAIPHSPMRKAIARRLTESKSTVPHFYLTAECRVDDLLALRAKANENSSTKISVNDFVINAVAAAFQDVPSANVTWTDTHLRQWQSVDIAVAVATDGGLLTPVVRGVENLSLTQIATTVQELAGRARAGRLRQDELEGGSFSVTNLGMYGTTEFSAILNPPQSGILAVGAARQAAVVVDGELAVATVMTCTLSADHRAIDGALAAQWLAAFTARIENPVSMLV